MPTNSLDLCSCRFQAAVQRARSLILSLVLTLFFAVPPLYAGDTFRDQNTERVDQLRHDLREMIASARDRVFPSLVNIRVLTSRYFNGEEQKGQSVGSGTIISPKGYVLTNYHVARNGRKFICTLSDKQEINAELVGEDPLTDLAILKLNLDELSDKGNSLSYATLGDSDSLIIGDTVMSMGSPWALSRSVTLGIISNTDRVFTDSVDDTGVRRLNRDQRTGIFTNWIQHDSAISPGNSGGPLVNLSGEVVGVNALGSRTGGMGFAIPSNLAIEVATAIIKNGQVPRSWFGWKLKPIKKSGFTEGVLINSVNEKGPAATAGVEAGDIIVKIDDQPVTLWFPEQKPPLLAHLASYPAGSKVSLERSRDGELETLTLTTSKLEADRGREASFRNWGLVAIEITPSMARNRRLSIDSGVLIQSVRPGSPAQVAEPQLGRDDVIVSVNDTSIETLSDLIDIHESQESDNESPTEWLFEFSRRERNQITLLKSRKNKGTGVSLEVAKAWIGIAVQPVVANLAKHLGIPGSNGFRITRVYPGTLAEQSDLETGDIIVKLNGDALRPNGRQDAGMLHRQVRRLEIGDTATVTVLRDGTEQDISLTLERTRLTASEVEREINEDFGFTLRGLTFFDRDENRWPNDLKGLLIEKVERAGWAQLGGLRARDLVLSIDGQAVENLRQFRDIMDSVTRSRKERIIFVVLRGVETRFQYIEPDWAPQVSSTPASVDSMTASPTSRKQ
jgi:serine protease Do